MATLILEDGSRYEGTLFGRKAPVTGEVVFTTGMTGYQETLTDPSYCGQIVCMTYPLIGNVGINALDSESAGVRMRGFIVAELCDVPSNWQCEKTLDQYLDEQGVTGLCGVDTRALTKHVRVFGTLRGRIVEGEPTEEDLALTRAFEMHDQVAQCTCKEAYDIPAGEAGDELLCPASREGWKLPATATDAKEGRTGSPSGSGSGHSPVKIADTPSATDATDSVAAEQVGGGSGHSPVRIAVMDFGLKRGILNSLHERGCALRVFPAYTPASEVLASGCDGVMLTNGPGDPQDNPLAIAAIRELMDKIPVFGICLGHQLMALAMGGRTVQMKYGHHGVNHPVKDLARGTCSVTAQNHCFMVDPEHLPAGAVVSHVNWNDQTVEGVRYTDRPAFSVQFHPEACGGPRETGYLFDDFLAMVRREKEARHA